MTLLFVAILALAPPAGIASPAAASPGRWTPARAADWANRTGWLVGCNFIPSTATNELEMWQADTFDPATIDRELGFAQALGFNTVRVFLHNLLWQQDAEGFLQRLDWFVTLAAVHHIKVMFVLFDSCWDPNPQLGPQQAPRPFVHNSRWVQSPGRDYLAHPERLDELKPYVQGVIGHFQHDSRVVVWDLFNEPGNLNHRSYGWEEPPDKLASSLILLKKAFAWAREVDPIQPLTSGVWGAAQPTPTAIEKIQLGESDIITFHDYDPLPGVQERVSALRRLDRPLVCTEYMARPLGSTFDPVLGYFRRQNIGALNWGFVSGKTQTIYPWDSWQKRYTREPTVWFHDILRPDDTPFSAEEVRYIRSVTMPGAAPVRP